MQQGFYFDRILIERMRGISRIVILRFSLNTQFSGNPENRISDNCSYQTDANGPSAFQTRHVSFGQPFFQ